MCPALSRLTLIAALVAGSTTAQGADCEGLPGVQCDADGTARLSVPGRGSSVRPLDNLGNYTLPYHDQVGTLGAVTFQGDGTRCIGLLRRGVCK
jgi:hypothetical protein